MINSKKKGFTIVELVIVIAVIAILSAVLIPTFSNLVKKANESADIQAVRNMNVYLAQAEATEGVNSILDVYEIFDESDYGVENYQPLYKGRYFFYDKQKNQILYVDEDDKVLFPNDSKGTTQGNNDWFSLSMEIQTEKPSDFVDGNYEYNVSNAAQLAWVVEDLNNKIKSGSITNPVTINVNDNIDCKGASIFIEKINIDLTIKASSQATIKNITNVAYALKGDGTTEGFKGIYGSALIGYVVNYGSLNIENITFENINIKNTHTSGIAILVGVLSGKMTINNVTIKNSTVIGHRNVGSVVGNLSVTDGIKGSTFSLENVDVKTVGGNAGKIIGFTNHLDLINNETGKSEFMGFNFTYTIDDNCSLSIYECEQNTGTSPNGDKLGLQKDNTIYSWCKNNGERKYYDSKDKKYYFEDALVICSEAGIFAK